SSKTPPKEETPPGAPEKYAFSAPEGQELDAGAVAAFEPVARELNLTQEQAQKLVDVYGGMKQQQAEAWQQQTEDWAATVKADKDIGGDSLATNLTVAQKALDTFGTKELKEYLNGTGLGNHPELVKFCIKVGKGMGEDQLITGDPKTGGELDLISAFYPKK
ncbi:peptidase, partial [Salmonella enterica subsp. enterica]|nr:peptidase [Salmonella enterica subsp. enterica]